MFQTSLTKISETIRHVPKKCKEIWDSGRGKVGWEAVMVEHYHFHPVKYNLVYEKVKNNVYKNHEIKNFFSFELNIIMN